MDKGRKDRKAEEGGVEMLLGKIFLWGRALAAACIITYAWGERNCRCRVHHWIAGFLG